MNKYSIIFLVFFLPIITFAQSRPTQNWIDFSGKNTTKWLQYAPGKMGPNALLVPKMDYALIESDSKLEFGTHYHKMPGDTAINSFVSWYWNIAPGKAAIEIWGQPSETFHMTNAVRDERQIYKDNEGWMTQAGDLLISTYAQIIEGKKYWPDISINYTLKTTTGDDYHARFTDASMNYFYLAMGKSLYPNTKLIDEIRIAGLLGFYVWQTNKVEMAQDEGRVFETGIQLRKTNYSFYTEFGGYEGYDAYEYMDRQNNEDLIQGNNDPLILRTRIEKAGTHFNFTAEYQHGFRDYHYETFRLGIIYHFPAW